MKVPRDEDKDEDDEHTHDTHKRNRRRHAVRDDASGNPFPEASVFEEHQPQHTIGVFDKRTTWYALGETANIQSSNDGDHHRRAASSMASMTTAASCVESTGNDSLPPHHDKETNHHHRHHHRVANSIDNHGVSMATWSPTKRLYATMWIGYEDDFLEPPHKKLRVAVR